MIFLEAIEKGIIRDGDAIDPTNIIQKRKKRVYITLEESGYSKEQIIPKENLNWFYAKDRNGKPAIWGTHTADIFLRGKKAYEHGIEAMEKVCTLYSSSSKLGLNIRVMDKDDAQYLINNENIPNTLYCWIGTTNKDEKFLELYYLFEEKIISTILSYSNGRLIGGNGLGIVPIITDFSSKFYIQEENGIWKLSYKVF